MKHQRLTVVGSITLVLVALSAMLATWSPATVSSAHAALAKPPKPPVVLQWTTDVHQWDGGQWDGAMAAAAAHVEDGYEDWRLPTVEELQAALQDGSWGLDLPPDQIGHMSHWTSKSQGQWAWAVTVFLDGDGAPIIEQSGEARKVLKTSRFAGVKFVRQQ